MKFLKYFFFNYVLLILSFTIFNFKVFGFNDSCAAETYNSYSKFLFTKNSSAQGWFNFIFLLIVLGFLILVLFPFLIEVLLLFIRKIFDNSTYKIRKSPASSLIKIADLLPKKLRDNLIQEISDMRLEYYEALSKKKFWRARFLVYSYYIGLSWSVVMWISDKVKEVVGIIPKKN